MWKCYAKHPTVLAENCFQATCTIKPCSHPDELEHSGALEQPSPDGIQSVPLWGVTSSDVGLTCYY